VKKAISKIELEKRKKRADIILQELKNLFPDSKIALNFSNTLELLIAVMLSAQCTDKKVNEVTSKLFLKYKKLDDYLSVKVEEFEKDIHSTGFYHNKAKNILATARLIKTRFAGKVPASMEELLTLPGVARKTANIVLGDGFGKTVGIAVDTHVRRLANLHGLTTENDPDKIEQDLMLIVPKEEWLNFNHRLIDYGRKFCPARKHRHEECPMTKKLFGI
jgi:endonuclease III